MSTCLQVGGDIAVYAEPVKLDAFNETLARFKYQLLAGNRGTINLYRLAGNRRTKVRRFHQLPDPVRSVLCRLVMPCA